MPRFCPARTVIGACRRIRRVDSIALDSRNRMVAALCRGDTGFERGFRSIGFTFGVGKGALARRAQEGVGGQAEPVIGPTEGRTRWLCPPHDASHILEHAL